MTEHDEHIPTDPAPEQGPEQTPAQTPAPGSTQDRQADLEALSMDLAEHGGLRYAERIDISAWSGRGSTGNRSQE